MSNFKNTQNINISGVRAMQEFLSKSHFFSVNIPLGSAVGSRLKLKHSGDIFEWDFLKFCQIAETRIKYLPNSQLFGKNFVISSVHP